MKALAVRSSLSKQLNKRSLIVQNTSLLRQLVRSSSSVRSIMKLLIVACPKLSRCRIVRSPCPWLTPVRNVLITDVM